MLLYDNTKSFSEVRELIAGKFYTIILVLHAQAVNQSFTTPALKEIAKAAVKKGTGARGLRRIMESILLESMYTAP